MSFRYGDTMKNNYKINEDTITIFIKDKELFINKEFLFLVIKSKIWLRNWNGYCYAMIRHNGKDHRLHRVIMNCFDMKVVDHINHNTLDNRKSNLRICTRQQNQMNMRTSIDNKSGFKGVCYEKRRKHFRATIRINKKQKHLGSYKTAETAALAYNKAAIEYYGEFGYLNEI